MTTITTAARRIARELNATPDSIAVSFDAEGNMVDRHEAGIHGTTPHGMQHPHRIRQVEERRPQHLLEHGGLDGGRQGGRGNHAEGATVAKATA